MIGVSILSLVLASHLAYSSVSPEPFKIAPFGPHAGHLLRAVPKGPHTEISGSYETLYFELVQRKGEVVLYPFVVLPNRKGFLVPDSPGKDLPEYRVVARSPTDKQEIKLGTYLDGGAIHAMFGEDEVRRLGIAAGDPLTVVVTVINEGMSKEALFHIENSPLL